ncbi:hypothetical protein [Mucilaginibacter sp. 5C4]|uniref:hypothetical protein n=1 Tax=Mucilaginibacter sp. 5C4 TaxID=3048589 RepID=UPI002AC89FB0|nr:hypothetical protein [Mucilaginibacter sp. 5C4]MEB0302400.1 hypothetical protein [Mucilaginibacter sp. 5C4]WPX22966.1 hypothetical protein RHM67_16925 [Mucilaginibacter sp. 5C4]
MARSAEEIQDQILTEKAARPELNGLNSVSNSAIYLLWIILTSNIIAFFERIMDLFEVRIQAIQDSKQYGTDEWWFDIVMAYQHGDLLAFINNIYQYPVIDASKQIVKFCSITSLNGRVQIKAAGSAGGQPVVLDNDQINGLTAYLKQKRPSGSKWLVQSLQADTLKIFGNVYYNASGDINVIKPAVKAAIQTFLSELNTASSTATNRNFDGTLYVNKLIDAIQAVPGVIENQFDLLQISAKNGADAYQIFTSSYQPKSGYFKIDPDFDLDTTLTYIA